MLKTSPNDVLPGGDEKIMGFGGIILWIQIRSTNKIILAAFPFKT